MSAGAVGRRSDPVLATWTSSDALLYALAVGAGASDPTGGELELTTENSAGIVQRVLPTFAAVIGGPPGELIASVGDFDPRMAVHGEQALEWHAPVPVEGDVVSESTIAAVYDKGSGAVVVTETVVTDRATSSPLWTNRSSAFIRGAGGFGGERGPSRSTAMPYRPPDESVSYPTRREQALLFRLCGDRNPLHSDPAFARAVGFDRPILHGLCTFGFVGRALLGTMCGSEPERFVSISARFAAPVYPGQTLTVSIWRDGNGSASFRATTPSGVVIDCGRFDYRES